MLEGSNLNIPGSIQFLWLHLVFEFLHLIEGVMILLGTPSINLSFDIETSLFFACVILSYTSLYFYYSWRELIKENHRLKECLSDFDNQS